MYIVVGSRAAKVHIPTFREGSDLDLWSVERIQDCDNSVVPQEVISCFEYDSLANRCATLNDIPCFNLFFEEDRERILRFIGQ